MVGVRSGKGEIVEGVGERLRRTREKNQLSLADVSAELHIPVKQLVALESDDYSVFSAELYARGAYSTYAKYLGIHTNISSHAFLRSLSSVRERIPLTLHTPATFFERLIHPKIILAFAGFFLALLVGGYISWQLQSFWRLPNLTIDDSLSFVTSERSLTITGTAEEQSQLFVNEESVLLQEDSHFSVPLILHKGINPVRIEVKNAAGRVRAAQLFLLRT
ncbi:MAG: helix-turn-helix domain-containing protein [bacterium]|nr:helix-turn-helix domain-containing protein [bacterium]